MKSYLEKLNECLDCNVLVYSDLFLLILRVQESVFIWMKVYAFTM